LNIIKKIQNFLKELFQFEAYDLDFGIYYNLKYKRTKIEKFIQEVFKIKLRVPLLNICMKD